MLEIMSHLTGSITAGLIVALISYSVIAIKYNRKDIATIAVICCLVTGMAWGLYSAISVSIGFIFLTLYILKKKNQHEIRKNTKIF